MFCIEQLDNSTQFDKLTLAILTVLRGAINTAKYLAQPQATRAHQIS
jgi:hypothetical protein